MNRQYLQIICLIFVFWGCGRSPSAESERVSIIGQGIDLKSRPAMSTLLTEDQMDLLMAGQGCFGLVEGQESCCDWVRKHFTWLWSFHLAGTAEAIAAHIEGRPSGRCF